MLEHEELRDRKPSKFLRHLNTLAGTTVPKTLWLGQLPTHMQAILATHTEDRLEEVAEQADRIHEIERKTQVFEAMTPANTAQEAQIKALCRQMANK